MPKFYGGARDHNEPEIVQAFRHLLWDVVRIREIDLVAKCPYGHTLFVEVKQPQGRLTKFQRDWLERGFPLEIVRSVADVAELVETHGRTCPERA